MTEKKNEKDYRKNQGAVGKAHNIVQYIRITPQ